MLVKFFSLYATGFSVSGEQRLSIPVAFRVHRIVKQKLGENNLSHAICYSYGTDKNRALQFKSSLVNTV